MKTSGAGTEGVFVLGALILLTLVGIAVMDGPHNFFNSANRLLINTAERVVLWAQSRW